MSRTAQLIVGAVTDFVMTAGATLTGYMMGQGGVVMPSAAMILLAVLIGAVAAAKQVRGMAMDLKPLVILLALAVSLTGCAGVADVVREMAKDSATVCVQINTIYGTARAARTNIENGNVQCNSEGMTVKSDAQAVGVPITVVPQITIGAPLSLGGGSVVAPPR